MYTTCAEAFVCSAFYDKPMYIDCIALCQLLCWMKDAWYSAHPNHLITQRVAFLYYLFSQKKKTNKSYQQNDAGYQLLTTDGASSYPLASVSLFLLCLEKLSHKSLI